MWIKCLAEGQKCRGTDGNRTRNPLIQSQGFNPIYHGTVRLTIYSNAAVYGEKLVRCIQSLVYFHFFEALNGAFEVQFLSGIHFTPYQRH